MKFLKKYFEKNINSICPKSRRFESWGYLDHVLVIWYLIQYSLFQRETLGMSTSMLMHHVVNWTERYV